MIAAEVMSQVVGEVTHADESLTINEANSAASPEV
jgi:hypothetical protein